MIENLINVFLSILFIGGIGGCFCAVIFLYLKAANDILKGRDL